MDANPTQPSRPRLGSSLWGPRPAPCMSVRVLLCIRVHACPRVTVCVPCVCGLTAGAPEAAALSSHWCWAYMGWWSRWLTEHLLCPSPWPRATSPAEWASQFDEWRSGPCLPAGLGLEGGTERPGLE